MDLGISNSNFYRLKDRLIFSTTPWRSMVPLEKWISSSWRDRDMAVEEVARIRNIYLLADICQLGMDEQKVNVLARECCDDIKRKNKPFILSHHMLPGPQQGQEKMSKSDPSSSIFMEDDEGEVNVKMKKAYCPQKIAEGNPCLEYIQYLVLPWFIEFTVERSADNGGNKFHKP